MQTTEVSKFQRFLYSFPRCTLGDIRQRPADRRADSRVKAAVIRRVLRELHIKGVSVRIGRGTARRYVDIFTPAPDEAEHERGKYPHGNAPYAAVDDVEHYCAACRLHVYARQRLETILRAALPDYSDRSDYQTDHFDFVYIVH